MRIHHHNAYHYDHCGQFIFFIWNNHRIIEIIRQPTLGYKYKWWIKLINNKVLPVLLRMLRALIKIHRACSSFSTEETTSTSTSTLGFCSCANCWSSQMTESFDADDRRDVDGRPMTGWNGVVGWNGSTVALSSEFATLGSTAVTDRRLAASRCRQRNSWAACASAFYCNFWSMRIYHQHAYHYNHYACLASSVG